MFFLKELPTEEMVRNYTRNYSSDPTRISETLHMMRRASLLIRKLEAYFASHNLSQLRFLILIVIDREPDEQSALTPQDILDRLDVSKPVLSRTLQTMERDALIRITTNKKDGRSKSVFLTDQGRAKLTAVLPDYYALLVEDL
ncbi:MarR family winged helix-turn-helix transcriptional regulator [Epibacterium ulvae]|uniref:MarR family winged helix-turn-helix transcriptional regulator n=1 Tax=Epibacterium ulvae TaxID=1156985 RepID=UPI002493B40F|nr:MarR family transcriptional regulator [Epibacterium ulvae]